MNDKYSGYGIEVKNDSHYKGILIIIIRLIS